MFRSSIRGARVLLAHSRTFATRTGATQSHSLVTASRVLGAGALATGAVFVASGPIFADNNVDYDAVRKAIAEILDDDAHDDGSYGPIFVRLAWHAAGTYDKASDTGGSSTGASMRFSPESDWGANAGLHKARARLESVKQQFPEISYADLWSLAGVVAIEEMGGPKIEWSGGRVDCTEETAPKLADGLLPDAAQGPPHLRDIFYRMGFNDKEIVALSGAHTLGRCHDTSSGFVNPWTNAPTTFSNLYFQDLFNKTWTRKQWSGPTQYEDETGTLMMLPTDMCLLDDPKFRKFAEQYAKDEQVFFKDFAGAFSKLLSLGMGGGKPWYKIW